MQFLYMVIYVKGFFIDKNIFFLSFEVVLRYNDKKWQLNVQIYIGIQLQDFCII